MSAAVTPEPLPPLPPSSLSPEAIAHLQSRLNDAGYGPVTVDGRYGPVTDDAYRRYLDDLDPTTPSLTPPPERPWYAKPLFLAAAASLLVGVTGQTGVSADAVQGVLEQIVTLALGLVALWQSWRGEPPLDRGALLPGVRRPAPERLRPAPALLPGQPDATGRPAAPAGPLDEHSH